MWAHPWAVYWASLVAFVIVFFYVAMDAFEDGPLRRVVGDWALLLPLGVVILWIGSAVRGVMFTARRSRTRAVVVGVAAAVLIVTIPTLIAIPLTAGARSMARIAKAKADTRTLASAVSMYSAHMGAPPNSLATLTSPATNAKGEVAGPFIPAVPSPPRGWTPYTLEVPRPHEFRISSSGDGLRIEVP